MKRLIIVGNPFQIVIALLIRKGIFKGKEDITDIKSSLSEKLFGLYKENKYPFALSR